MGQLELGQLELGQIQLGQLELGHSELVQLESGQLELGQLGLSVSYEPKMKLLKSKRHVYWFSLYWKISENNG